MRHRVKGKKLGRSKSHRKALYRSLATSLVEHGAIKTTLAKAKAVKPIVEHLVSIAKKDDLTARRRLLSFLTKKEAVEKLISKIAPSYKKRAGGYLRIVKLGRRLGDRAEMARIEFIKEAKGAKNKSDKEKRD